ncbi:MotA/TolQ/ExbB proton channel family protein [bacterium]|nr:MotA/TolQ/ExbB proton channel family protein [bacterium]
MFGFLLGVGCILAAICWEGGPVTAFVRPSILVLVLGGALGATFTSHSVVTVWKAFCSSSRGGCLKKRKYETLIRLSRYAGIVRHKGHLALEVEVKNEPDPVLAAALQAVVDGCRLEEVENFACAGYSREIRDVQTIERFYESLGGSCPTFGLIGTVVGLVSMMVGMKNPDMMARGMASSFVATFYGMLLSNVLFLPLSSRAREKVKEFECFSDNVLTGLRLVQAGAAPRTLLERLGEPMGLEHVPTFQEAEVTEHAKRIVSFEGKSRENGSSLKKRFAKFV